MKGGSKYQSLLEYLRRSSQRELTLTFREIEVIMGETLPDSARVKRGWWSNRSKGALQASAWMQVGYLVEELDINEEPVTFRKPTAGYKVQRVGGTVQWNSDLIKALRVHSYQ